MYKKLLATDKYFPIIKERLGKEEIQALHQLLVSEPHLKDVLDAFSLPVFILNQHRQVILSNKVFLDFLGGISQEHILGLRPGEIVNCIHAQETEHGCGTADACAVCGAVQAVMESIRKNLKVEMDAVVNVTHNGQLNGLHFLVSAAPYTVKDQPFYLVTMRDIASDKRKELMEKIFFHDIINNAGNIKTLVEQIEADKNKSLQTEYFGFIHSESKQLIKQIHNYRNLALAENGKLETDITIDEPQKFLLNMLNENISLHKEQEWSFINNIERTPVYLETDFSLLAQVIDNMLRNAKEANKYKKPIELGCELDNSEVIIWVKNLSYISPKNQLQIFNRNFSTKDQKDKKRGIGTFSIKILTENYLKGKASFTSTEADGTTFFIRLPLKYPDA